MAKSKKELLAGRQKVGRPSLRREIVTNDEQEAAVVRKVSDNPPPPSPTSPAPAAAAGAKKREPTGKKAEPTAAKSTAKETAKKPAAKKKPEPFMRMTFDVPKSLHLKLKMHTLKNGVTIKAHMLRIIEESIK